jgi:hypothetical protein
MPHEAVLGKIYTSVKALLAAHAPLTALLATKPVGSGAAIYDDGAVPQAATMPYLTIGAGVQLPWNTMGETGMPRYGWECSFQVKGTAQISETNGMNLMTQVAAALPDGKELSIAGYGSGWVEQFTLQPTLITLVAGVATREWPAILRAYVHDTI